MWRIKRRGTIRAVLIAVIFIGAALIIGKWDVLAGKGTRVFIETPGPCAQLDRVENEKVYLKSSEEHCSDEINKTLVEIDPSIKVVRIYLDGKFWKEQKVDPFNLDSVQNTLKQSEQMEKTLSLSENRFKQEAEAKAGQAARLFTSEAYQKKLQAETERLKGTLFKKQPDEMSIGPAETAGPAERNMLLSTERIYLFVSSSMPVRTLRNYAKDIDKISDPNISMVMRGLIGGMKHAKPTLEFVSEVIVKDPGCKIAKQQCEAYPVQLNVDPLLFRKYRITQVPAVVYVPHTNITEPDRSEGLTEVEKEFYVLYGDASLEYLLETLRRETKSRSIEKAVAALSH